jgi:hypothetical protein
MFHLHSNTNVNYKLISIQFNVSFIFIISIGRDSKWFKFDTYNTNASHNRPVCNSYVQNTFCTLQIRADYVKECAESKTSYEKRCKCVKSDLIRWRILVVYV